MVQVLKAPLILQSLSRRRKLFQVPVPLPSSSYLKDTFHPKTSFQDNKRLSSLNRKEISSNFNQSVNSNRRSNMLISIDGNISSGKSSLVSKLVEYFTNSNNANNVNLATARLQKQNEPATAGAESTSPVSSDSNLLNGHGPQLSAVELEVIPEPLEKWCNLKGYNLLDLFYKDPKKYNFLFQHYVQLTRLQDTIKASSTNAAPSGLSSFGVRAPAASKNTNTKVQIMERSLQNNRFCFLELARKSSQLDPAEFTVLAEWYNWLENNMNLDLDLIIYLKTSPEIAYSRMLSRGRSEESNCPLTYLADLHEAYEDWLIRDGKIKECSKSQGVNQQIIVLDANKSREEVASDCVEKLTSFLKNSNNK